MLIGLGKNMTCIDFWFTRSKFKVTSVIFVKKRFWLILLETIYYRAIIFYMLICLNEDMTSVDFEFTRLNVKVTRITCKKCKPGFRSLS